MESSTFTADKRSVSNVCMGSTFVTAVNAVCVEFIVFYKLANVGLLLLCLRANWKTLTLHLFNCTLNFENNNIFPNNNILTIIMIHDIFSSYSRVAANYTKRQNRNFYKDL